MRASTTLSRPPNAIIGSVASLTLVAAAITGLTSSAAAASTPTDLIIAGSVARASATYETEGNHIDLSTLSGLTAVGGAYVELTWMSTDLRDEGSETKAGPKEGDRTPLIIVGVAQADKDGNFAIHSKPSAEMIKEARKNDGWINFMMATNSGADYVLEWVSRHWNGKSWTEFGKERPDQSPSHQRQTLFASDAKTGLKKYGTNPELLNKVRTLDIAPYSLSGCDFLHDYYSYAHTVVMEFHNTADADGHWEYGGTADSTIDAGVKYDGTNWTVGGSKQISNSASSAIGGNTSAHYGKYIATNFRYKNGTLIHSANWCSWNGDFATIPDRWEGGGVSTPWDVSQYDCLDAPQSNYKDQYQVGQYWKKSTARAAKIGVAVKFGPLSLGATSGYSSKVDMDWRAVRNWIYICGNNAYPANAQIVYVY